MDPVEFLRFAESLNHADYDMNHAGEERASTAEVWLDEAADCIRTLELAFGGPGRAAVVASIRKARDGVYGAGR